MALAAPAKSPSTTAACRVWAWENNRTVWDQMNHGGGVNFAEFSHRDGGIRVMTASDDNTARIWEAATGTLIGGPLPHKGKVSSATFSPDGLRVLTASDETALIWEVMLDFGADGEEVGLLSDPAEAESGYDVEKLPALVPLSERERCLEELLQRARQPPHIWSSMASFVFRYFGDSK